jgi:hypothetical protein
MSEPTFVASRVEDGQVDAYTPSGNLLGVFRDRIEAVEAVVQNADVRRPGLPVRCDKHAMPRQRENF